MVRKPPPPGRAEPAKWKHYALWNRVREAILALPAHFESETNIEGMLATDIFTLNSALGATIEEQVVATLNALRPVWDPGKQYQTYGFVRQAQVQRTMHTEVRGISASRWLEFFKKHAT